MLSRRVREIGLSPTLRISGLAQELRASGVDVLDFSAGQPDFPTPEGVKEAGRRAIAENKTRYTPNPGLPELRRAIAEQFEQERGMRYAPEQILVSTGAKASLYFAFMALVESGDEVLLPQPYWVSYPEQIRLAGGRPVTVPCPEESGFKLEVDRLEAALSPRTRGIVLNYPSNPTGACYARDELETIGGFCLRHRLWIVADEIYSRLLYDGRTFTSVAALGPEIAGRTVVVDGMSKSYSMTGWRLGYAAGPAELISAMARLQSHSTSNASSISQWAGLEAIRSAGDEVRHRAEEFQRRRDEIVTRLRELDGVRCNLPEGAFYVFPNVSSFFGRRTGEGSLGSGGDVAEYLLRAARVALVPGDAFGAPAHVRVSYAVSLEGIREGVERIAAALDALD